MESTSSAQRNDSRDGQQGQPESLTTAQDIQSLIGLAESGFLSEADEITNVLKQQEGAGFTSAHAAVVGAHMKKLKGRLYEARTAYRHAALQLDQRHDANTICFIDNEIAHIDQMLGGYPRAREVYFKQLEQENTPPAVAQMAMTRIAEIHLLEGKFADAIGMAENAVTASNGNILLKVSAQRVLARVYQANVMLAKANAIQSEILSTTSHRNLPAIHQQIRLDLAETICVVAPQPAEIWADQGMLAARREGNALQAAQAQAVRGMARRAQGDRSYARMLAKARAMYAGVGYQCGEKSVVTLQCLAACGAGEEAAASEHLRVLDAMTETTGACRYMFEVCKMVMTGRVSKKFLWLSPQNLEDRINHLRGNLRQPISNERPGPSIAPPADLSTVDEYLLQEL